MKLKTLAILFILLPMLFLASCAEDDTEDPNNGVSDGELTSCLVGTFTYSDSDESRNIEFKADKSYIEQYSDISFSDYEYTEGTWSVSNGALELVQSKYGYSSTSLNEAIGNASTENVYPVKDRFNNLYCSDLYFSEYSFTGGNTNTLEGTWNTVSNPEYQLLGLDSGEYKKIYEYYYSLRLGDTASTLNYDLYYYGCSDGNGNYSGSCVDEEFYTNPVYSYYDADDIERVSLTAPAEYIDFATSWTKSDNEITLTYSDESTASVSFVIENSTLLFGGDYLTRQ